LNMADVVRKLILMTLPLQHTNCKQVIQNEFQILTMVQHGIYRIQQHMVKVYYNKSINTRSQRDHHINRPVNVS